MKITASLLIALCLAVSSGPRTASAQSPPGTDILLVRLSTLPVSPTAADVSNLTDRDGYDNQPAFMSDGRSLLYTSGRGEQTDIYRIDLTTGTTIQVTDTPESEYSPALLPSGDGFSVVRVETDETQRLWRFDPDGKAPALVLEGVLPVGYYAWIDDHTVAVFIVGDPPLLQLADTRTGQAETRFSNIGRSLHRVPGTVAVSFVSKEVEGAWTIRQLDPATGEAAVLAETLPGREDFAWRPDGSLLMADGSVLYTRTADGGAWQPLADFAGVGVGNITRIAVSPDGDYAALVVDRQ